MTPPPTRSKVTLNIVRSNFLLEAIIRRNIRRQTGTIYNNEQNLLAYANGLAILAKNENYLKNIITKLDNNQKYKG